jgi:hypothetical protein
MGQVNLSTYIDSQIHRFSDGALVKLGIVDFLISPSIDVATARNLPFA